ncbi:MAG: L-2-amino-thiazoline-4-carboxylic acid hydrolase [bacterium]|nr:L-2-amino-thiazoline-4-carboxylic acid hydrolase [bacterium]
MKYDDTNNYYMKIKRKMMKEFNAMYKGTQKSLMLYFDKAKITELQLESNSEYINLFSQLPYLGGKKSNSTINLIMGAIILSIIIPLEKEGLTSHQIGKVIFDAFDGYFKSKPKVIRFLIGKIAATGFFISEMKKQNDKSLLRKYKEDFVVENIKATGQDFDFGYNYTECALHKLFINNNKSHYLQYVCLGDYAMFKSYGISFFRTQTIGNGAPICDFRFKKKAVTFKGWPPENLDEWKEID